jgi:hypothetical protein
MTGDFGFDLGFRLDVINSVEQQNLFNSMPARQARRAGIEPPRPILNILNEFITEKIGRLVREDPTEAMRGCRELRTVLRSLVYGIKHPEFTGDLKKVETIMAGIGETARQQLVKAFRDPATRPKERDEIRDTLVECIECGAWPNWQEEVEGWGRPDADRVSS